MIEHNDIRAFLRQLTTRPGVYRMYDADGGLLYVGKARNLQRRVSSYFMRSSNDPRIAAMVEQVDRIEVTVARNEDEALLLEANLIKQQSPRYNIMYRDDKSYPYLRISTGHPFARISFYRGAPQGGHRYFGPYPSAHAVRQTLASLQKLFRLRPCSDSYFANRSRPCLQHQIGRCSAPCVGRIGAEEYARDLADAERLLRGQGEHLIGALSEEMEAASAALDFERAARLRDRIAALRRLQDARVLGGRIGDVDLIAVAGEGRSACLVVLSVRGGLNQGHRSHFPKAPAGTPAGELIGAFLSQHYAECPVPAEIVVSAEPEDVEWLQSLLSRRAGRRVRIQSRPRAERRRLLQLAERTAAQALAARNASSASMRERYAALAKALDIDEAIERMECFDISHTGGERAVASCVVFDASGPRKPDYRRFNIQDVEPGDDYAAIRQAVLRRFRRAASGEHPLPDLLLIDGGKGQLAATLAALDEAGAADVPIVAVSKGSGRRPGLEQLHRPGRATVSLAADSPALHLIQQIRDEAHRFAITGHRGRRDKARTASRLEEIPGLGPVRRRALLKHFGGMQQLRRADVAELARVDGISRALAERVHAALQG